LLPDFLVGHFSLLSRLFHLLLTRRLHLAPNVQFSRIQQKSLTRKMSKQCTELEMTYIGASHLVKHITNYNFQTRRIEIRTSICYSERQKL
jgi:hypothetical protein